MEHSKDSVSAAVFHGNDFASWKEKVVATLRFQGLGTYVEGPPQDRQYDSESRERSFRAATFISMLVSPAIVQRVALSERTNASLLLQRLESLSHFRFLDLSAELRNRV